MNCDWCSLTVLTQVIVGAVFVETLVPGTTNGCVTFVASGAVDDMRAEDITEHKAVWLRDLHESMPRVVFGGDREAGLASVEVRAVETFVSAPADSRIAQVAYRVVDYGRLRCLPLFWLAGSRGHRTSLGLLGEYGVYDDLARLRDLIELMPRAMVALGALVDAITAQVVVYAVEALVADSDDDIFTLVADDVRVDNRPVVRVHSSTDGVEACAFALRRDREE